MKKILNILLISILLLSSITGTTVSFAADAAGSVSNEAATVLERLGAVSLADMEGQDNTPVSRASYATLVASALKLSESGTSVYFEDVLRDHSAVTAVNALYERGLISGTGGGNFKPDDNISFAAALKIMLNAAGYGEYAEGKGGFPSGYIIAGEKLEVIPDNINSDGTITTSQAAELIYNIMKVGLYDPVVISGDGSLIKEVSDETLLSTIWNIYVEEGILETYYGGSINSQTVARGEILVDGEKYLCEKGFNADSFLAEHIEFIYEKSGNDKTVFYAQTSDLQSESKVIDSVSILSFDRDTYTIEYEAENGSTKTVKPDRGSVVIYNGSPYEDSIPAIFEEFTSEYKRGTVKIVESAMGGYDTIVVESYRNFVVNYSDTEGEKLYSKLQAGDVIDLTKYDETLIRNLNNIDTQISSSDAGYAISAAESKDGTRIKIITLTNVNTGVIEEFTSGTNEITIDGTVYKLDKNFAEKELSDKNGNIMSGILKIGKTYKFNLDRFGYIAYMTETEPGSAYSVGYLMACDYGTSGLDRSLRLKLLGETNGVQIFETAEKITVDEQKYTNVLQALRAVELAAYEADNPGAVISDVPLKGVTNYNDTSGANPQITPQLIRYQLDSEGKLHRIDTSHVSSAEDSDYSLTRQAHIDGLDRPVYRQHTVNDGHFGSAILYKKGTTAVFMIPLTNKDGYLIAETDPSTVLSGNINVPALGSLTPVQTKICDTDGSYAEPDDNMYLYSKSQSFYSDSRYAVVAYNYTKTSPYADAIVCMYNKYIENENAIMFEKLTSGLDQEGNVCTYLKGWEAGSEVSYIVGDNSDLSSLSLGDLLYSWVNVDKTEIAFVKKVYDASENTFVNYPHTYNETRNVPEYWWSIMYNTYNGSTGAITGYQHAARWLLTKGKVLDKNSNVLYWDWDGNYRDYEEAMDISSVPVVVCNFGLNNNNIKLGNMGDITDYKTVGDTCSYLVMNMRHSQGRCAYIYIR